MTEPIPIVIPAFRRTVSLSRLMTSLLRADIPAGTPLILSIDRATDEHHRSANQAVRELAHTLRWPHGALKIVDHERPLGLIGNTYFCHALAADYGAIIVLEDDLVVGRPFHTYATQALAAYGSDPRIAGISLNTLWFNGFTHQPFIPLPDASDTFFLQLGTPQGQVYSAEMWQSYANWLATGTSEAAQPLVHPLVAQMAATDWLPDKIRYLAATGRTYVFPRESLTVSFGDAGTHISGDTAFFQVPLQDSRRDFRLGALDEGTAVYDSFYEMLPNRLQRLNPGLTGIDFAVDLYATKARSQLTAEKTLTSRPAHRALTSYAKVMRPMEANVIHDMKGEGLALANVADVDFTDKATMTTHVANDAYFGRYRRAVRRGRWFGRR